MAQYSQEITCEYCIAKFLRTPIFYGKPQLAASDSNNFMESYENSVSVSFFELTNSHVYGVFWFMWGRMLNIILQNFT